MPGILPALALPALLAAAPSPLCALRGFFTPAADSAAVKKIHGVVAVSNPSTRTSLQVQEGSLRFGADLTVDSGRPYSARAAVRIPVDAAWAAHDFRAIGAIEFRVRSPGGSLRLNVSLGSDAYRYRDLGVVEVAPVRVDTSWKTISLSLSPYPVFSWLEWMENDSLYPGGVAATLRMDPTDSLYDSDSLNAAKAVRYLEIALDPQWRTDSTWSTPGAGTTTLQIDDVRFVSMFEDACWSWYAAGEGRSCSNGLPSVVLADHAPGSQDRNLMGGLWSAHLDTGAAMGKSSLRLPVGASGWHIDTSRREATLIADLARKEGSLSGGFAGVGTRTPPGMHLSSDDLAGIGFSMRIPEGASLDSNKVAGVWFKVGKLSDSAPYYTFLPHDRFQKGKAEVCIDFWTLTQTWTGMETPAPQFSPREITSFSWELAIVDSSTSVPNQGFSIGPVTLYGIPSVPCECPAGDDCRCPEILVTGAGPRGQVVRGPAASWRGGRVNLTGFEASRHIEIRTLGGVRVASLTSSAGGQVDLPRGTYLVVGTTSAGILARPLVVAR